MFCRVLILLAIATLSAAGAIINPTAADQSFLKYMINNRFSNDPEVALQCFGYYIPILNGVSDEFSKNFQKCASDENDHIAKLNDNAFRDRYQIEKAADDVCVRLSNCNDLEEPLQFFDCYSEQGSDDSKTLYVVTQNSTKKGGELREQYHLAYVEKYKCQNASERAYVEDTARTYKQLDICLRTGEVPSTISPETTTPAIITTTIKDNETTTTIPENNETTEKEPEDITTKAPENEPEEHVSNGRGLKILSELQRFWKK